jgi:hypothetical protein
MNYKRDHPAVVPHEFHRNSKTVQSTMDALDRIARESWVPRDEVLSRKARRLKSTYATSDIVNHPELRTRLVHTPERGSRVSEGVLDANVNIVTDDRGFYPDGSRPGGLVKYKVVDVKKAAFAAATAVHKSNSVGSAPDRRSRVLPSKPPFYAAGSGLGPVASLSQTARYGPNNSTQGHARHQDSTLSFDPDLHASISVTDDPATGATSLRWPSLGGEHMAHSTLTAIDAMAANYGICDVHEPRVDSYGKISPMDWPEDAGYTRGSAIVRNKKAAAAAAADQSSLYYDSYAGGVNNTSSFAKTMSAPSNSIVVPRGIARSIERDGIRKTQVHAMALQKRREDTKAHGRWLQGKSSSDSLYTQYSDSGANVYDPSVIERNRQKKNSNKSEFNSRMASYGDLASQFLDLSGGPKNPFRNTMNLSSSVAEHSVGGAGTFSVVMSKSSHLKKSRSNLVQAVAKSVKSHRLASSSKIHCLATFGEIMVTTPNNLPGHAAITELARCLVDTASSNPNPEVISRNQFVGVILAQVVHTDLQDCHNIYSCFDPNGREAMEWMEFLCCLLAVHRPSMNSLTSGHYSYARAYNACIPVIVRGIEIFDNGRGGVTKHDLRKILNAVCISATDRAIINKHVDQIFELLKVPFEKFAVPKILTEEEIIGRNGLLVKNSFVLDEYQKQLLVLQEEVQKVKDFIKEKKTG